MLCKQCGRDFMPNTTRQIYCDVFCSDKAQHRKSRERARLGRLNTAHAVEHLGPTQAQLDEERWRKARDAIRLESEAAALEALTGYKSKQPADIPVPDTGISEDEAKVGNMKLEDI